MANHTWRWSGTSGTSVTWKPSSSSSGTSWHLACKDLHICFTCGTCKRLWRISMLRFMEPHSKISTPTTGAPQFRIEVNVGW